ncbi:Hypothetical predicted protein [Olea europaea subsp. europaea]|uniref:Uncharacterized protein n=2 Tax=Olea europaea subsp. europaea TaxID=158383 RepID=A0A8S0QYS4_OLEEU|nr:Hypothetical predicted protein [Olea europaea subsp. europaea]
MMAAVFHFTMVDLRDEGTGVSVLPDHQDDDFGVRDGRLYFEFAYSLNSGFRFGMLTTPTHFLLCVKRYVEIFADEMCEADFSGL